MKIKIGDLVKHENCHYDTIGIVTDADTMKSVDGDQYTMVTVYWLDNMGTGIYWTDELEALCK